MIVSGENRMSGSKTIWFSRKTHFQIEKFCRENNHMKDGKPQFSKGVRIMVDLASKESTIEALAFEAQMNKYRDKYVEALQVIESMEIQNILDAKPLVEE